MQACKITRCAVRKKDSIAALATVFSGEMKQQNRTKNYPTAQVSIPNHNNTTQK